MFYVNILADVGGQFVVLFFLELGIALDFVMSSVALSPIHELLEQMLYDGGVVEKAVNVGADAMVGLKDGLIRVAHTLMYLIALTSLPVE